MSADDSCINYSDNDINPIETILNYVVLLRLLDGDKNILYNTAIMNKVMIHQFTGNNIPFYIGYGVLEKGMDYHAHDHYELMIVLSGSATHIIEDQEYPLEKGDVYLVTNSFSHAFQQVKQLEHYNIFLI